MRRPFSPPEGSGFWSGWEGKLATGIVAAAALVTLTWVALAMAARLAERRLDGAWAESLASLESLSERYPPTRVNRTARAVEVAAAGMGIALAPPAAQGRLRPGEAETARWQEAGPALKAFAGELMAAQASPGPDAPPAVEAALEELRPALEEVVAVLRGGDPPVWACDLGQGLRAPSPNLPGQIGLVRALALAAWDAASRGRRAEASDLLDASWRLSEPTWQRPELISQLAAQSMLRTQLAVLRQLAGVGSRWRQRLGGLQVAAGLLQSYQVEAYAVRKVVTRSFPDSPREPTPARLATGLARPLLRLMVADYEEALVRAVSELPHRDAASFDGDAFFRELADDIPRWNVVARVLLPRNPWDAWPWAVRLDLGTDLTLRIDEARERLAREDGESLATELTGAAARVEGRSWRYRWDGEAITIALDTELPGRAPDLSLSFSVR